MSKKTDPFVGFPMECPDAENVQRFNIGDDVSHNAGLIEADTKRRILAVVGYDHHGGVQYRLTMPDGSERGLAYDCELDPWPGDDVVLPVVSPRSPATERPTHDQG